MKDHDKNKICLFQRQLPVIELSDPDKCSVVFIIADVNQIYKYRNEILPPRLLV
jgi:hypothetical protein